MKKTTLTAAVSIAAALTLTGCSLSESTSTDETPSGSNAQTSEQVDGAELAEGTEEVEEAGDDTSEDSEEGSDETHEFGSTATYRDGLSVTVSSPSDYTPSESSFGSEGYPHSVKFDVKLVNKSGKPFDPSLVYLSVQSGNTEAEEIFDSENGLDGSPTTTLLDGRESTFPVAFGVSDPKDLVLEVSTGDFDKGTTIFVTGN